MRSAADWIYSFMCKDRNATLDLALCLLLFMCLFLIFYASPILRIDDSRYTVMLSEQLLMNRSFNLADYFWPHVDSRNYWGVKPGHVWPRQIAEANGHLYYIYPHGSSLLSLPFVAAHRMFGISSILPGNDYDALGENTIQKNTAAVLMAVLGVVFFLTARLKLPRGSCLLIALAGTLSTQVWSTASRSLQSHTWNILLLAIALYLLLRADTGKGSLRPVLLATILSFGFFVRPTAALYIVPIACMVFIRYPKYFPMFFATGLIWLGILITHSLFVYNEPLPIYYGRIQKLSTQTWGIALAAQLISPSRGLFVFVPLVLFVGSLIMAYREYLDNKCLVYTSIAAIVAQVLVVASYHPNWWAGASYGPRYQTDLVPLFVMLGIIGAQGRSRWKRQLFQDTLAQRPRRFLFENGVFLFCFTIGVLFNGAGAISRGSQEWYNRPNPIPVNTMRIFEWKRSQFMCALFPGLLESNDAGAESETASPEFSYE